MIVTFIKWWGEGGGGGVEGGCGKGGLILSLCLAQAWLSLSHTLYLEYNMQSNLIYPGAKRQSDSRDQAIHCHLHPQHSCHRICHSPQRNEQCQFAAEQKKKIDQQKTQCQLTNWSYTRSNRTYLYGIQFSQKLLHHYTLWLFLICIARYINIIDDNLDRQLAILLLRNYSYLE